MLRTPNERSAADSFAGILEGRAKEKFYAVSKSTSVRIPIIELAAIDAFAESTNSNRNKVIIQLLHVGIEEVFKKIQDEDLKENLRELQGKILKKFIPDIEISTEIFDSETPSDLPSR